LTKITRENASIMIEACSAIKKLQFQTMSERRNILANDDSHSQEPNLGAVFDQHIKHEFQDHDVDVTIETMTKELYVHHVPMMTGGIGYAGVYNFYKNHFIGKMPDDTKIVRISRTVGKDQVVDELVLSFTHDREIDFILPGVPPTGRHIELPHVVIMNFRDEKLLMNTYTGIKHLFLFKLVCLIQNYCL
jgi:hypothetical protein